MSELVSTLLNREENDEQHDRKATMTKTNGEKTTMKWVIKIGGIFILLLYGTVQYFILDYLGKQEKHNITVDARLTSIDSTLQASVWKDSLRIRDYNDLNERVEVLENERP